MGLGSIVALCGWSPKTQPRLITHRNVYGVGHARKNLEHLSNAEGAGQEVGHDGASADGKTAGKVRPDWTGSIHEGLGGLIMARTTLANARCRKFPGPLSREGLTLSRVSPYQRLPHHLGRPCGGSPKP